MIPAEAGTTTDQRTAPHGSAVHEIGANTKSLEFTRGRARVPNLRIVISP